MGEKEGRDGEREEGREEGERKIFLKKKQKEKKALGF